MKFDPEKSLFDLSAVRWTALISTALSAIVFLSIISDSKLATKLDYVGFNLAVTIFKVPLGILAVGLSLIGIYGANHRSEQTKRQIERSAKQIDLTTKQIDLTRYQNNFANYYKHIEEFVKYCEKEFANGQVALSRPRKSHKYLFHDVRNGEYFIAHDHVQRFECDMYTYIDLYDRFLTSDSLRTAYMISKHVELILTDFGFNISRTGKNFIIDDQKFEIIGEEFTSFIDFQINSFVAIDQLFQFDEGYNSPKILKALAQYDRSKVPHGDVLSVRNFSLRELIVVPQELKKDMLSARNLH